MNYSAWRPSIKFVFGLGLLGLTLVGLPMRGFAQDLIPFKAGSSWTLRAFLSNNPLQISIQSVQAFGPDTIAQMNISQQQIGTFSLLITTAADGIYLTGYAQNGITYRFPASLPYFLTGRPTGSSWQSPLGKIQLTDTNLTITSQKGITYKGCYRYVITGAAGDKQIWILKPGLGFVQFGEGPSEFSLISYTLTTGSNADTALTAATCPAIGLSSIPSGPTVTDTDRAAAFQEALDSNASVLKVEASWLELEPQPGVYDFSRIRAELTLGSKAGVPIIFDIKTIDTIILSLPDDLQGLPLDDDRVLRRWAALLQAVQPQLPPQVRWVNLGYEVDYYLLFHPEALQPFVKFYEFGSSILKQKGDYSVGVIFQYDNSRISDQVFQQLLTIGDHVAVNYYGQTEGFVMRDPSVPLVDIPVLIASVGGRPIVFTEVGYSSSPITDGSLEKQGQFVQNVFNALKLNSGSVVAVNFWAIRDLPSLFVQSLIDLYKIDDPRFQAFLGSLGLESEDGVAKPAWTVFRNGASNFSSGLVCARPL